MKGSHLNIHRVSKLKSTETAKVSIREKKKMKYKKEKNKGDRKSWPKVSK